ncbi:MAG TPA: recombinase RecT, partial [Solirubrobacterales bacterium]
DPPAAARVGIRRKGFPEPQYVPVHWREFKQTQFDGNLVAMWKEKPAHMLAKTAASLAIRAAFPDEAGGLYTAEEMAGFGGVEEAPSSKAGAERPPAESAAVSSSSARPPATVDPPSRQPSAPAAKPAIERSLVEILERSDHSRLRADLAKCAFNQLAGRLSEEETERLTAALRAADEGAITVVELERACRKGLKTDNVALRQKALFQWIDERRKRVGRVSGAAESEPVDDGDGAPADEGAPVGGEGAPQASEPEPSSGEESPTADLPGGEDAATVAEGEETSAADTGAQPGTLLDQIPPRQS